MTDLLSVDDFRDQMIAASLKPSPGANVVTGNFEFPRSDDRGLIEAAYPPILADTATDFRDQMIAASLKLNAGIGLNDGPTGFPRSDDRGLIEAGCAMFIALLYWYFRDQMIAASLKQTVSQNACVARDISAIR